MLKVQKVKFIIGCNRSQLIVNLLRAKGYEAFSCDLQEADEPTEFHIKDDIFNVLNNGDFTHGIFHPPCTYLTVANTYLTRGCSLYTADEAKELQADGIDFFLRLVNKTTEKKIKSGFENPIGVMSKHYRPADQIIQPYEFGDNASKSTCLWLNGLPLLQKKRKNYYPPRFVNGLPRWGNQTDSGQNAEPPGAERMNIRSKTFPGIAKAMADQWPGIAQEMLF